MGIGSPGAASPQTFAPVTWLPSVECGLARGDFCGGHLGWGVPPVAELRLVLITGLSGAGKTEASRALEDAGFYVVDNLPAALIPTFAELCAGSAHVDRAALVVDIRGREFFSSVAGTLDQLVQRGVPYELLFLDADDAVLVRRYKESRRRHPLAPAGRVSDGIAEERRRIAPLRARAQRVIDTTGLRPAELRARVRALYAGDGAPRLAVTLVSFGFKHGLPADADLVLDVRFLPNPHYDLELRPLSGRDRPVADYVLRAPVTRRFLELVEPLLDFLLPHYAAEGKAQLVVAIGCTGGRHRSVVVAECLAEHLRRPGYTVESVHRDCDLDAEPEDMEARAPEDAARGLARAPDAAPQGRGTTVPGPAAPAPAAPDPDAPDVAPRL